MKRIINKATSFRAADQWDIRQNNRLPLAERYRAAELLKERAYGKNRPDVRETEVCVRTSR